MARRYLADLTVPAVGELQAELLGLIAEHEAGPPVVLAAFIGAAMQYAREHLSAKQGERALEEMQDALDIPWRS